MGQDKRDTHTEKNKNEKIEKGTAYHPHNVSRVWFWFNFLVKQAKKKQKTKKKTTTKKRLNEKIRVFLVQSFADEESV